MLAVWGTADIGLPHPGWRGATDRFPINWTGGFDPKRAVVQVLPIWHTSFQRMEKPRPIGIKPIGSEAIAPRQIGPSKGSGRAIANGRDEGGTKLLFDDSQKAHGHGKILGGGMVGTLAGDMIGDVVVAIEMRADAIDIDKTIHPHLTLARASAWRWRWREALAPICRLHAVDAGHSLSPFSFFGLPAATGACVACPESTLLCITGDGSLQMRPMELSTIAPDHPLMSMIRHPQVVAEEL
jgi:hypothetical protein